MLHRTLADLVVVAHLGFVAFAALGALLALRWRWIPWLQLPAVAWGVFVEFAGWPCPLTPLEIALRRAGGGAGYDEGFVEHHVLPVLYPGDLTRELQMGLGVALLGANALAYGIVWRHRSRLAPRARRSDAG